MFDYHMHTRVSFDAHETGEAMAKAALAKGLKEICFTDHYDFNDVYKDKRDLFTIEQFCDLQVSNIVIPSIVRDLAKCSGELRMTRCGERVIDISHREIFRYAQQHVFLPTVV